MNFEVEEFLRIEGESVALAVVIEESPYIKGLIFEVDLVEMLKSIGAKDHWYNRGLSMDSFTPGAIDAALEIAEPLEPSELLDPLEQLPTYPIIVTDVDRLPKYLINA
ncbi:2327_t:CDS:2, partial [Dentiscutata heterogama]